MTNTEHQWFAGIGDRTGIDRVPGGILVKGPPLARPLLVPFDAIHSAVADVARDHPVNRDGAPRHLALPAPAGVQHAITFALRYPVHTPRFEHHRARASGVSRRDRRRGMDVDRVTVPVTHLAEALDLIRRAGITVTDERPPVAAPPPAPTPQPSSPPPAAPMPPAGPPPPTTQWRGGSTPPAAAWPWRPATVTPVRPRRVMAIIAMTLAVLTVVVVFQRIGTHESVRSQLSPAIRVGTVPNVDPTGFDVDELAANPFLQATRPAGLVARGQELDRARHPDGPYLDGKGLVKAGEVVDANRTTVVSLEMFDTVVQAQEFHSDATLRLYRDFPPAHGQPQGPGVVEIETYWDAPSEPGDPHFLTFILGRVRVLIIYSGTGDQGPNADNAAKVVDQYLRSKSANLQPAPPVSGPPSTVVPTSTVPGGVSLEGPPEEQPTSFNIDALLADPQFQATITKEGLQARDLDRNQHPDGPYLQDVGLVEARELVDPNRIKSVSLELFATREQAEAFHTAATNRLYASDVSKSQTMLPPAVPGATTWRLVRGVGYPYMVTFLRGRVRVVIIALTGHSDYIGDKALDSARAVDAYLRTVP